MKENRLIYKLEGDSSIDANTLINVLIHNVALLERANELVGDGTQKVNIKVKALNAGSFEIVLDIMTSPIMQTVLRFFKPESLTLAASIAGIVSCVYTIFAKKRGSKLTIEEVQALLEVMNNTQIRVEDIIRAYEDIKMRKALQGALQTIDKEEGADGLTITSGYPGVFENADGTPFHLSKEEVTELARVEVAVPPSEQTVIDEDAVLSIVALSFEQGRRWDFIYQGNKITAKVDDAELQQAIDNGRRFAKGDSIRAVLEIKQAYVEEYNAYQNKAYKVLRVIEHKPRPGQGTFEFKK